jgi:RNA polymerase sigma factor (TIGR02999 family)
LPGGKPPTNLIPVEQKPMSEVSQILGAVRAGNEESAGQLFVLVYAELKRMAAQKMAGEAPGNTLQPTALVHEAWMRLVGDGDPQFQNRAHFFAAAAEAMRRILVDSARRKRAQKRGGGVVAEELREDHWVEEGPSDNLLTVDEALDVLAREDPKAAELVKLRYFAGMSMTESAETLGMPLRSTEALWAYARAWLRRHIGRQRSDSELT